MKGKRLFIMFLFLISCTFAFSACTNDSCDNTYKNYKASGLEVKSIPLDYEDDAILFGYNRVELFSDYGSYAAYNFNLCYTESYFELNDLLVFVVKCCSSDEMEFNEILENEKKLYPLFYRKEIGSDQPITDNIIVMSYCVEISKKTEYKIGEIIYRYK